MKGTPIEFSDANLARMADIARIRKLYKLSGGGDDGGKGKRRRKDGTEEGSNSVGEVSGKDDGSGEESERKELEIAVLGLMALRGQV